MATVALTVTAFDRIVVTFHLDRLGLQRGVLAPSVYGANNTVLLDALRAAPDRLRGVAHSGRPTHTFHVGCRISDC